mmetsp:Transcript_118494/g.330589  ORF Transcript_118494/g.330589 Transcript_118494/m.330589 type:complete len:231 (+) Transcript_118494:961-1653(+)
MLPHKVLLGRLIRLRRHLDRAVQEVHLVDEQVAEDPGAIADDVDARAAQLIERNELYPVDTPKVVRHRPGAHQCQDLRKALAVCLDVVRTPEGERNGFRQLLRLTHAFEQPVHHHQCSVSCRFCRDGLRVQSMHVLTRWQHVGVADGITTRPGLDELAVERAQEAGQLVVANHLPEADLQVLEERRQRTLIAIREARASEGLLPRAAACEEVHDVPHERVHFLDAAFRVG